MKQKLAVVLVTFNRLDKLKIALKCYENQTKDIEEVIVVDNGSSDGTKEFLNEWKEDKVNFKKSIVLLNENTGGAGGFYAGMKTVLKNVHDDTLKIDWIFVSDDDAFPENDALEKLCDYYEKISDKEKESIVALSGAVINQGQIHESHRSRIEKSKFRVKFVGVSKEEYEKDAFDIDLFSYVGTMMKVTALEKVGITNKDLFIYGDDNEHSIRLKKEGRLVCVTNSRFNHDTPGVGNRSVGWHNYYNRRNQLYILKKYFPKRYLISRLLKRYIMDISFMSKYNKEERRLFKVAQNDALREKLGKHPIYKPGFHFKEYM